MTIDERLALQQTFDPVSLEVARHRLQSVAEEMGAVLIRTAYSPNIKDRRDCSTALFAPDGALVAQAEHIPLHLGLMPTAVAGVLDVFPPEVLEPGDTIMTNDPFLGSSHLPDICVVSPVFADTKLVGLVANLAHHVDVGGISAGGIAVGAKEIFQEGIRVPPLFVRRQGKIVDDVVRLLLTNVRTAWVTRGDLLAQLGANSLGERRLIELHAEWGELLQTHFKWLIDYGERRTRGALASLPDGHGTFTDYLEHTGRAETEIPISAVVAIEADGIRIDLTGSASQVAGSVNCSRAVTIGCAVFAVKAVADPSLPANAGATRPIEVVTRRGTVVDADFPAAVSSGNINTAQRVVDAVLGALAQIVPERVPAASSGSMSILTIGGIDPRTRGYYSYVETYAGGQGASAAQDGMDGVHTNMTNTRNTPVEVIEQEYPLRVRGYALRPDTGGAGRTRGGCGLRREIELLAGIADVTVSTDRRRHRPWGAAGGGSGAGSRTLVTRDGIDAEMSTMFTVELQSEDVVAIETPGGGGHGDPTRRDPEAVARDVAEGLVTEQAWKRAVDEAQA